MNPLKQYRIILDSIEDGVFTVDVGWHIMSFNKAAEKITGIPREEAIGQPCYEVFRANVCQSSCVLRQTMKSGEPIRDMPVHIVRSDNKRIPVSVSTSVLMDEAGEVVGGVETFRDLTLLQELRKELHAYHSLEDIVSKNAKMLELFAIVPQIAQSDTTVLIEGASGTGKELLARAIHHSSQRKAGPFVAVNCGALPENLLESELFGYKAGAFTDAKKDKPGRFAMAENGTIFLDEIGDVSQPAQVRLLRVLETKKYEPLGSNETVSTNTRIITATHRDLEKLVQEERFREDLYYRINVVKLYIPPLAERKEDIPLLVDHFISHFNSLTNRKIVGMSQEAMAALILHNWPGNIRELENAVEHAFVLCQGELIQMKCLPRRLIPQDQTLLQEGLTLKEIEKNAIRTALQRNKWKKVATARELGIDKNTLRRKIKRLGIVEPL